MKYLISLLFLSVMAHGEVIQLPSDASGCETLTNRFNPRKTYEFTLRTGMKLQVAPNGKSVSYDPIVGNSWKPSPRYHLGGCAVFFDANNNFRIVDLP